MCTVLVSYAYSSLHCASQIEKEQEKSKYLSENPTKDLRIYIYIYNIIKVNGAMSFF